MAAFNEGAQVLTCAHNFLRQGAKLILEGTVGVTGGISSGTVTLKYNRVHTHKRWKETPVIIIS